MHMYVISKTITTWERESAGEGGGYVMAGAMGGEDH